MKLVAMADAFRDNIDNCYKSIGEELADNAAILAKIDVPEERKFTGFDGYLKAIPLADVVILCTPPGFRPIHFEEAVTGISIDKNTVKQVVTPKNSYTADVVIGGADYHHIEMQLLPEEARTYTPGYWSKRVMAPSCLLYYVGINKKLKNVLRKRDRVHPYFRPTQKRNP